MAVAGDSEDDDPDPLVSRTDIFRVCVLASAILHEGTSAFYIYLGNQAGNTNTVEDILVEISGAGSWLAWVSTWSPGGLWTPFLVCAQATISSSFQDSSASSKYLGNQAGNIFTVEDLLMGAEWWWNTAWLEDYIEHGLFLSSVVHCEVSLLLLNYVGFTETERCTREDRFLCGVEAIQGATLGRLLGMRDISMGNQQVQWELWGREGGCGDGADKGEQGGELQAQPREHQITGHQARGNTFHLDFLM